MASFSLSISLLFISFYKADGFENYYVSRCEFNSTELSDITYIYSSFYKRMEIFRFDSSLGKFIGHTQYGVKLADCWNNDPEELNKWKALKETYCLKNVKIEYSSFVTKSVQPTVRVQSVVHPAGHHPAMLLCSVYDYYPKKIKVSWLRDGQEVISDITSTNEIANGDWYHQIHSYLEYEPRSGEKISCMVEHISLKEPLITNWDPSTPESERNKIAIGASGMIFGLISSLAGYLYYKPKAQGLVPVPTN
ncbi:H-2 class II histocompatibility antigen, E-S beta chain-like [Cyprinodon tularosa]|uniref:H-2 class II histocompatibility antigen, E-S beta chain-like n=1 Tax=Cyprinodon tularosa TaxID=77115 RepID=UPI0018E268D6|nr:H-2 class II histocompatibility antigen, E-S beta chain-like [Cyprinodon tularosa]